MLPQDLFLAKRAPLEIMMNAGQTRVPISQLRPGDRITQVFLVAARELRQTKAGKSFIQATLQDGSGQIRAVMWDAGQAVVADFAPEAFIKAQVRVEQYQGASQLIIESFQPIDQDQIDLASIRTKTSASFGKKLSIICARLRTKLCCNCSSSSLPMSN